MKEKSYQSSQYVITARAQRGVVQQTRTRAASAVVLARCWTDAGYDDVQVIDPSGHALSAERYRIKIMNRGRAFR